MSLRLSSAAASDAGAHRAVNQDAAVAATWAAAVADGVGGGPGGDLASAALLRRWAARPVRPADELELIERLRGANGDLRAHMERDPGLDGMATTFTGIVVGADGRVLLAHTGDSRAYLLRAGSLAQRTRDDSLVQALLDQRLIAPEEAAVHPRRNVVTASFGGGMDDHVDVVDATAEAGDRWLLCSDGLSDYVPEPEIAAMLHRASTPRDAAVLLVEHALAVDTRDNVTVVVADVSEGVPRDEPATFAGSAAALFAEELEQLDGWA